MSELESHSREAVWSVMSILFLDNEVTASYPYITRICAESPYSIDELTDILITKVAPVCGVNLLSVAGIWDYFDDEWLIMAIQKKINKDSNYLAKKVSKIQTKIIYRYYIQAAWLVILCEIKKLRGLA